VQKFWREMILPIINLPTDRMHRHSTKAKKPTTAMTMVPVSSAVPLLGSPLLMLLLLLPAHTIHVASCFYIPRPSVVSIIRGVVPTNNNSHRHHGLAIVAPPPSITATRAPNKHIKTSPSAAAAAADVANSNTSLKSSMTDNVAEETGTIIAGP
jgi:hypothetical protein